MQWYYSETIMILYWNDIIMILPSKLRSQISRWDGDISCQILLGARCSDRWTGTRWYIAYIGFMYVWMYVCMHGCMHACMHAMNIQSDQPLVLMWTPLQVLIHHHISSCCRGRTSLILSTNHGLHWHLTQIVHLKKDNKISGLPKKNCFSLPNLSPVFLQMTRLDWLDPMFTWPFKNSANSAHHL